MLMSFGESCGGRDRRSCVVRCSLVCWDAPAGTTTTTCHGYDMGVEGEVVGLKRTKGMMAFREGGEDGSVSSSILSCCFLR